MNKLIPVFLFLITFNIAQGQIKALAENGRQVILFNNGTWKYNTDSLDDKGNNPDSIKMNAGKFSKSAAAAFVIKSKVFNIAVAVNTKDWTISTHRDNEVNPEYRFTSKSGNGMAMLITEKTPIDLSNMPAIALINAQKAAIDAKILKQEYRIVNNNKMLFLEMSATVQGIKFRYMGYYFSNEKGTVQLLSYTSAALYNAATKELETFLNGLVVID